jgi:DNA-binding transcriptional regulator YiaG
MDTLKVPDHMSEEDQEEFALKLDRIISETMTGTETRLRRLRLINRISQGRLAAASGVPVRTIQQYEQRRKDINKARFAQILKLAAVLNCEPSQLAEPEFIDF